MPGVGEDLEHRAPGGDELLALKRLAGNLNSTRRDGRVVAVLLATVGVGVREPDDVLRFGRDLPLDHVLPDAATERPYKRPIASVRLQAVQDRAHREFLAGMAEYEQRGRRCQHRADRGT